MALTDKLTAIGEAIREKTGKTELLSLDAMVEEIGSISGGDVSDKAIIESNHNFLYTTNYTNDEVKKIGNYVFYNVYNGQPLGNLSFPECEEIGDYVFSSNNVGNGYVKQTNMPKLRKIGNHCYSYLPKMNEYNFDNVEEMGDSNFYYRTFDTNIDIITFPKLRSMGKDNFTSLTYCTEIRMPELEQIGSNCFSNCSKLERLYLPKLQVIPYGAFQGLKYTKITKLSLPSLLQTSSYMIGDNAIITTIDLRGVRGNTETGTGATMAYAFSGNKSIQYVALQDIEGFYQTSNTTSPFFNCTTPASTIYVIIDKETPIHMASSFALAGSTTIMDKMKVLVPASSLSDWQNATNWSLYTIESIEANRDNIIGQFDWLDSKYFGG